MSKIISGVPYPFSVANGGIHLLAPVGGSIVNPSGITSAVNIVVCRFKIACTVTNVQAFRKGGTGATINAQKNGSLTHLSSALSLTSANTWMDGGTVQNTSYAIDDYLEIMLVSVSGAPTEIDILVAISAN